MKKVTRRSFILSGCSVLSALAIPSIGEAGGVSTKIEGPTSVSGRPGASVTLSATLRGKVVNTYIGLPNKKIKLYYRFYYTANQYRLNYQTEATTNKNGVVQFRVNTPQLPGRRFGYEMVFEGDKNANRAIYSVLVNSTN